MPSSISRAVLSLAAFPLALSAQATPPATPPAAPTAANAKLLADAQQLITQSRFDSAAVLLKRVVTSQPGMGRGWIALGDAHRGARRFADADSAYRMAIRTPAGPQALQSLLRLYAVTDQKDAAANVLADIRKAGIDLTAVAANSDLELLHDDQRFSMLFRDRVAFSPPFVEPTRVLREWRGERAGDEFGWIARGLGDVDRDGITDVVISATANPPYGKGDGTVYVYSGKTGRLIWKRREAPGSLLGTGLESAGDVDGDGVSDVIAGAPGMNAAFVYSGSTGKQIYRITGDSADVDLGTAVAGVGDVDGDGRADFVASAPSSRAGGQPTGRVYVYSGRTGKILSTLSGERANDSFGSTVGGASGRIIVGAGTAGDTHHGRVYVYDRLSAAPTFAKDADSTGLALGYMFVSMVGDVDGDGVADVYATDFANSAKGRATGRVYVYSGKTGDVIRTFTGTASGDGFGIGAARAGDIDGDGTADLVVGSWQYGGAAWSGGRVTVLSGKDGHALQTITGKVPGETFGFDAVAIGDIDHDGATDFLLTSAWSMVNGLRSGRVYIVAGSTKRATRR